MNENLLIIPLSIISMGIFGSIFIGVLFYNLNYYKKTKINYLELQSENLKLKIKLKKEENKKWI